MSHIGIIQPGRLGDILLCLPIAKHYHSIGYTVHWPIMRSFARMIMDRVDYVKFYEVTDDVWYTVYEAKNILKKINLSKTIDIAATFPGSTCTPEYTLQGDGFGKVKFDEFKYNIAGVDFTEKWNLAYTRDFAKEHELFNLYVKSDNYVFVNLVHSRGAEHVHIDTNKPQIFLNTKHNIFDWRMIIEKADHVITVDSAIACFIEQLSLNKKLIMIPKKGHPLPYLRNNWKFFDIHNESSIHNNTERSAPSTTQGLLPNHTQHL